VQWTCTGNADQNWVVSHGSYGTFYNPVTGHCLAVPGASKSAGTEVIQWTCGTGLEQSWEW